jgi:hypothetical protein
MKLSINRAWEETAALLKRDWGTLFLIAFGLSALPQIAVQALAPDPAEGAAAPGAGGVMLVSLLIVLLIGMIGNIAVAALALGREGVVGNAIRRGLARVLPLFGATILLGLVFVLVAGLAAALAGLTPETMFDGAGRPTPATAQTVLVLVVLGVALGTKFLLTTHAAAAEEGGPVAILKRSWKLTNGHYWRLLGFLLLMMLVFVLASLAVTAVLGILVTLVAGQPQPGSLGALILLFAGGLLNAAFVVVFITMLARIYAQLADAPPSADSTTGI